MYRFIILVIWALLFSPTVLAQDELVKLGDTLGKLREVNGIPSELTVITVNFSKTHDTHFYEKTKTVYVIDAKSKRICKIVIGAKKVGNYSCD